MLRGGHGRLARARPTLFGVTSTVRLDEVPTGGAEAAERLHHAAAVLARAHGDLSKGVTVPPVHQGTGLPVLTPPLSLPLPLLSLSGR